MDEDSAGNKASNSTCEECPEGMIHLCITRRSLTYVLTWYPMI